MGIVARVLAIGCFAIVLMGSLQAKASKTFNLEYDHVPSELIVTFHPDTNKSVKLSVLQMVQAQEVHSYRSAPSMQIKFLEKGDKQWLMEQATFLASQPEVKSVEANTIVRIIGHSEDEVIPNDEKFPELYAMKNDGQTGGTAGADISATKAWVSGTGSRDVLVGVIDTGIDYNHPDIASNYWFNQGEMGEDESGLDKKENGIDDDNNGYVDDWRGWNFVNDTNDPMDDNRHGTHCAGTIAAEGDNERGVVGVAWQASMVGIKFLSGSGSGTLADAVKSIEYATTIGVDLTSNSWGGGGYSEVMHNAIRAANDQGILFVAAAGNSSANNDVAPAYPASYDVENIISVAATDHNDALANFSSWGKGKVHLAAPGVAIVSAIPGEGYQALSGTSMAAPHVSGAVVLIKSLYPDVSVTQIKERLMNSVDHLDHLTTKVASSGRLNVFHATVEDNIGPSAVANMAVTEVGMTQAALSWDASGDDGDVGFAKRYEVRLSPTPVTTEAEWQAAESARVRMDSGVRSPVIEATVLGLPINFEGFVSIRALDKVGNISELSESIAIATKAIRQVAGFSGDSLEGITVEAPWGLQETDAGTVFADSPDAAYDNNVDASMYLPAMASDQPLLMTFNAAHDFELNYDFGYVEVSIDDGMTFIELAKFNGTQGWSNHMIDLTDIVTTENETLTVRFRVTSDSSITRNGWLIRQIKFFSPDSL